MSRPLKNGEVQQSTASIWRTYSAMHLGRVAHASLTDTWLGHRQCNAFADCALLGMCSLPQECLLCIIRSVAPSDKTHLEHSLLHHSTLSLHPLPLAKVSHATPDTSRLMPSQ